MRDPRGRLLAAAVLLATIVAASSFGFYVIGQGQWTPKDCVYFTFVTLTTVGYSETLANFSEIEHAREFTVLVLVFGMGAVLYFVSTLTASIIEGDLQRALRRTRMIKQISKLEDHVVVCGAGSTGTEVIRELVATGVPTVAIDSSEEQLEHLVRQFNDRSLVRYIVGDATDDDVLAEANVANARGIVAALANDKDNLFLVVTARQSSASARIVARGSSLGMLDKLTKAGADSVVSPNYIGGKRMVAELIRPEAVRFFDEIVRDPTSDIRIDEIPVMAGASADGSAIVDLDLRRDMEVLILAVRFDDGTIFFNPKADFVIEAGMTLVVLGPPREVDTVRTLLAAPRT